MLEVIAMCLEDAKQIEKYGGDRIELVSALTEGGLTPSYALIKNVVQAVKLPVNVMIRPHAKTFVYSAADIRIMKEDIQVVQELQANGIVLGVLDSQGNIDEAVLQELLATAGKLEVTFHKAIDEVDDLVQATKVLKKYPQIKRILTAGGKGQITGNTEVICKMLEAAGGQIKIMLGGGLTKSNIAQLLEKTKAIEVHFGTAVRYNASCFADIYGKLLKELTDNISAVRSG